MPKHILLTLRYFAHFEYAPTFDELYTFLEKKTTQKSLVRTLTVLKQQKILVEKQGRYTLGEYSKYLNKTIKKSSISASKRLKTKRFTNILNKLSFVKFVGFSGSVAVDNAELNDDMDLFIITSKNRMWITRFMCLIIAQILGVRRKRYYSEAPDKICLNLFFDEQNLAIPQLKKTLYVAHEILQIKPIINRDNTYERFLTRNSWIYDIFPNAQIDTVKKYRNMSKHNKKHRAGEVLTQVVQKEIYVIGNLLEYLSKAMQMYFINKHRTTERITDTQLWFFPRDYEKELKDVIKKK